jgi:16S rRNA (cytidine1402-2'-O)-methyltransferase
LLVAGAQPRKDFLSNDVEKTLLLLLEELPLKQAVQLAVKITGGNKNELYQRALEQKNSLG